MKPSHRGLQVLLIVSTLGFSWLGLQVVHEAGHVLHAWASGGAVVRVVLYPTTISQTQVSPNPHPCFVAWGGPIWGCLIPLALWGVIRITASSYAFLAQFFAGACLVANGIYVGTSVFTGGRELDGPVIMAHGGAAWQLLLFSAAAIVFGFWLWNGLGKHFGLGPAQGQIDHRAMSIAVILLVLLVAVELVCA